jgi:hypothetical protein
MTVLRHPLLHFLLLGGLLFGVQSVWPDAERQIIRVGADDLERLRADWQRDTARAPSDAELRASVERHVDEELLLREALALGLDRTDPVARERLVNNMRFAFPESSEGDDALLAQARKLGMHTRDLVVRRRLMQVMEMRIASQASLGEAELREYVARHPERYALPARYGFRHVFFSADRPPHEGAKAARAQLAKLQAQPSAENAGDPFLLGSEFPPRAEADIARRFGPEFAQAVTRLAPGQWAGPLRSPYGLHLVRLERVEAAVPQDFGQLRQRAAYALLAEREKALLRDELARLRLRYRVEVAAPASIGTLTLGMAQ